MNIISEFIIHISFIFIRKSTETHETNSYYAKKEQNCSTSSSARYLETHRVQTVQMQTKIEVLEN